MFTADDVRRAKRLVKMATAIDPYQFNSQEYTPESVRAMGWNVPKPEGFLPALGKTIGGYAAAPFDAARSALGFAPGNSMLRNWGGSLGKQVLGKYVYNDPAMVAEGHRQWNNPGQWAAPYGRAMEQSQNWRGALGRYMSTTPTGKFLLHPIETSRPWMKSFGGSSEF